MHCLLRTNSVFRYRIPLFTLKSSKHFEIFYNSASDHHNIRKFKLIKRLASTILFGSTFLAVIYARKQRRSKTFEDAKLVTVNPNYHKNFKLYEYKGFILPSFVMKNMDALKTFSSREDDIFVVSFPKTGRSIYNIIFKQSWLVDLNVIMQQILA